MIQKSKLGFTLIELMVTIAIAGILMMVAIPSFQEFMRNNELRSVSNGLYNAMLVAKNEAMTRNSHVLVAPYKDGDWKAGWRIFVDVNRNNSFGDGDVLISEFADVPVNIAISSINTSYVMYDGSGFSKQSNGAPFMGTISVTRKDTSAASQIRRIKIAISGKARICTPASATDVNCGASDAANTAG